MSKRYHVFILVLIVNFAFCQQNIKKKSRRYTDIENWKKTHERPLTKQDSAHFIIKNNDTLVLLEPVVRPKGRVVKYEYKDSTFLSYYTKIAFRLDQDSLDKKEIMRYWKKPLKVFFGKSVSNKERKEFKKFATSTINHIDSLHITFVSRLEDSNYIIYYSDDYNYESKMNIRKKSDFYMSWRGGRIKSFAMRIDNDYYFSDKLRLMEMKRYFIESLGYFRNLSEFSCDSYFSNCNSKEKHLTALDIELLKYHYSYGICKGTSYETFMEQHKMAKDILKKNPEYYMNFFHVFDTSDVQN